jgi:hypothetical protein
VIKKVLASGDWHCGHEYGLCPPAFWPLLALLPEKDQAFHRDLWQWFEASVRDHGPWDVFIGMGDMVDGQGARSKGTEQLTTDMLKQVEIAANVLNAIPMAEGGRHFFVRGTPYHTGDGEQYEDLLAARINGTIENHVWLDVHGCVIDARHHVGGSSIPHGKATPLMKQVLWSHEWEREGGPRANLLLRGHTHYYIGAETDHYKAFVVPPMQAPGSRYGELRCDGVVSLGFMEFQIEEDGTCNHIRHKYSLSAALPAPIKV